MYLLSLNLLNMIENLLNLVKQYAGDAIINNPDIPNERNEEAVQETAASIENGLQGVLAQGGVKDLLSMFTGRTGVTNDNPVVQNISGGLMETMMQKFGLDRGKAGGIVGSLLPVILGQLVNRTKDPNDNGFNIQDIFNGLSGGKTAGTDISGLAGRMMQGGLDKDGDGDVDLQDLMGMFSGGGNNASTRQSNNPLDALKGMFGQ